MLEMQSKEHAATTGEQEDELTRLNDKEVREVVAQVIAEYEFRGPIPPPNIISGYEKILPGAADRILTMAEKQSEHRQTMERKMIEAEARDSLLGVMSGFTLGAGCVVAAIVMAIVYPQSAGVISGAVLGSTGVASIAATAIKSTRRNRKNDNADDARE